MRDGHSCHPCLPCYLCHLCHLCKLHCNLFSDMGNDHSDMGNGHSDMDGHTIHISCQSDGWDCNSKDPTEDYIGILLMKKYTHTHTLVPKIYISA